MPARAMIWRPTRALPGRSRTVADSVSWRRHSSATRASTRHPLLARGGSRSCRPRADPLEIAIPRPVGDAVLEPRPDVGRRLRVQPLARAAGERERVAVPDRALQSPPGSRRGDACRRPAARAPRPGARPWPALAAVARTPPRAGRCPARALRHPEQRIAGGQRHEPRRERHALERVVCAGLEFHPWPAARAALSASVSWRSTRSRPAPQKSGSARSMPTIAAIASGGRDPPAASISR